MLKVLVTGAFSTGKTTLVGQLEAALRQRGIRVQVVPDLARKCPLPLNNDQTESTSLWLLMSQVVQEIEAVESGVDVVLCDRGIPDVLAHHELKAPGPECQIDKLRPFLEYWMTSYEVVLLSRVDEAKPIQGDSLRLIDPAYRTRLDVLAKKVLQDTKIVKELPTDEARRLNYALDVIREKLPSRG